RAMVPDIRRAAVRTEGLAFLLGRHGLGSGSTVAWMLMMFGVVSGRPFGKLRAGYWASLFLGVCLGFFFGFVFAVQGFGVAEEEFAQGQRSGFFCGFFRVGGLFLRADEGAVLVLVGLADDETQVSCAFGFANLGHPAVAVVLRGHLQSVDEDSCAA